MSAKTPRRPVTRPLPGKPDDVPRRGSRRGAVSRWSAAAQRAFHHRAHMNGLAAEGKWKPELEKAVA